MAYVVGKTDGGVGADVPGVVVHGYDPMYVAFIDETSARSYPTSAWEYDFGDEIVYGMTDGERRTADGLATVVSKYMLPGDKQLLSEILGAGSDSWLNGTARDTFDIVSIMNPRMAVGWMPGNPVPTGAKFITYPSADDLSDMAAEDTRGMRHITSFSFVRTSGDDNSFSSSHNYEEGTLSGFGEWRFVDYFPTSASPDTPMFRRAVSGAELVVAQRGSDDCSRGGLCEQNTGDGSTVGHLYKGPGYYTVSLRQRSTSPRATAGQIPDEMDFVKSGMEYAVATIVVHPTCPCVETHILGKYEEVPKPSDTRVFQCVLSSEEYSADNPGFYGVEKSYLDWNPTRFELYDSERNLIFDGISGYAPFVMATTKVTVRQASIPVSGIRVENGDWYTDTTELYTGFANEYESGWPSWKPTSTVGNVGWENGKLAVSSTHTYVMPGIYKPSVHLSYNTDRTRTEFAEEMEECEFPTIPIVMVKEILPKNPKIDRMGLSSVDGVTTMEFSFSARAGSYPFADVVWDFDDGTKPMKLSRNVEDGYAEGVIVGDRTTAVYVGPYNVDELVVSGMDYGSLDLNSTSSVSGLPNTAAVPYPDGMYPGFDPRDWVVYHEYTRTCAEDRYQYVVSAMGYVCNTETMTIATYVTSADELGMPEFRKTEGEVKLIDARTFSNDDDVVMTLEGDNGKRTTLFNLKWEGDTENGN